jgi:3-oxoacyl-[acyl-carrier protein] reductase
MANFLILGGASAIAQATKVLLLEQGHQVTVTARNSDRVNPDMIVDATDFDAVDKAFAECGELAGVVNCAGSLLLKPAHLTSKKDYEDTINASLTTAFATVRAAGKHMKKGGSVVLLSSAAAQEGLANHEAIAAAKAGIIGLTLSAAASYAHCNLRFNCVAPGLTNTPLTASIFSNDSARTVSESLHALPRLGDAGDTARAIAFLLDPQNSWITAQVLAVDGGLSRVKTKPRN